MFLPFNACKAILHNTKMINNVMTAYGVRLSFNVVRTYKLSLMLFNTGQLGYKMIQVELEHKSRSFILVTTVNQRQVSFNITSIQFGVLHLLQKLLKTFSQDLREAAWPSGRRVGLAIRRSRARVPFWPLAGFVLGRPKFKFSATLVNSQLVASCQLGF